MAKIQRITLTLPGGTDHELFNFALAQLYLKNLRMVQVQQASTLPSLTKSDLNSSSNLAWRILVG
jgi:hypothetical protein